MTPPDHDLPADEPLDDDTLAVHAVVDDEATPEQRRRVARDPALVAQVAALRGAVAAIATPVPSPSDDVLASIRGRALDLGLAPEADETPEPDDGPESSVDDAPSPYIAPPVRDLGAARERRARRLPPLPAVAAVVILLVVVGVGLLVRGGTDAKRADSGASSADEATVAAEGGGEAGGDSDDAAASDGPSAGFQQDLLAAATARYASDEELLDELRRVDTRTLALGGSAVESTDGEGATTTTAAPPTTAPSEDGAPSTTTTTAAESAPGDARVAAELASDPEVQRCDSVLRSVEPDLGPVTAAALVEVDGIPVLVLSNPVETSDQAPTGVRLTVLNAVDCSPRAAVVR